MKNLNLKYILLCLLLVFIVVGCRNKNTEQNIEVQYDYHKLVEEKISRLTSENLNKQLDNQLVYFGVDSLKKTDLTQITKNHLFFFYFSNRTCSPCIQQTVDFIKEVFPDYETNSRIIFISPDYPVRFRRNCYGKKLLVLETEQIGIPLEQENLPFIFTLNEALVINNLHIVNKEDFEKTKQFLEQIK
jgi:hypothetical protein